jgi:hypothetical protein
VELGRRVQTYSLAVAWGVSFHYSWWVARLLFTDYASISRSAGDEKDPVTKAQLVTKLQKARDRRYIAAGQVDLLTAFFAVKKGDDVRPVYDGSVSGLNKSIWMPRFVLPTIQSHLRQVEAGTFMCDLDVGEMFLNFILHQSIRPLAGVDLTHYVPDGAARIVW